MATGMPDFRRDRALCADFLERFKDDKDVPKYMKQLTQILSRTRILLEVSLDDIEQHGFLGLVHEIENDTMTYTAIFSRAADALMQDTNLFLPERFSSVEKDALDYLRQSREARLNQTEDPQAATNPQNTIPPELLRRYDVFFIPRTLQTPSKFREVDAEHIGKLITFKAIVTEATDVKPLIEVATYIDEDASCEVYQVIKGRSFTPLTYGPPQVAAQGGNKQPLKLSTRGSKFVAYQEVKIQEVSNEVPQGNTARGMNVHLRGGLTRTCKPGDAVQISGVYLPEPAEGIQAMKMGLVANVYLEAMAVKQLKQSYEQHASDIELQQRMLVCYALMHEAVAGDPDMYDRLSSSLAPEIFGHEDVKKALLLQMVSGVSKTLPDGLKLRGDIHICLMGDPGVAKSQLIKHIAHISPRAVYTTGKGSSGVGLTAAVHRDPVTQDMVLEGGALVLADKGICCIDEFDKMDEADRTNIHEVMEQQTVSIAKAGINTTLNTRTTLLAAANPAWGTYNTRKSPAENINLPAALLSRFDLLWLMLDKVDADQDAKLAAHVLAVHKLGRPPQREGHEPLPPELLRAYIAHAKTFEPTVPRELTEFIAVVYAEMRAEEAKNKMSASYTTPRTLQSILRLAQALARLRFDSSIVQLDIDEALRLMRMSKISLEDSQGSADVEEDSCTSIFSAIRNDAGRLGKTQYTWSELVTLLGRKYTNDRIRAAVEEYEGYNVFFLEYPHPEEPTVTLLGIE